MNFLRFFSAIVFQFHSIIFGEYTLYDSNPLNLPRLLLWPVLENVICALENKIYSAIVVWTVL